MDEHTCTVKPVKNGPLKKKKKKKIGFQDQLSLNAGQKYCRMLQGDHSAILSTFIKLPFVIKIFILSIFEWPFLTQVLLYMCMQRRIKSRELAQALYIFKPIKKMSRLRKSYNQFFGGTSEIVSLF